MSTEWFYTKDGEQLGPVSSKQLSQLAASGELQPTDLVWKEGAPDWKPASIVKGLFAETTTPPPPVPADSAAATPASPALGEAARGLFSAVTAKAKEFEDKATAAARGLGDKAAEAAKAIEGNQWREPNDGTPANPLLATLQARKRLIVFCIIGLFVFSIGISLLLMLISPPAGGIRKSGGPRGEYLDQIAKRHDAMYSLGIGSMDLAPGTSTAVSLDVFEVDHPNEIVIGVDEDGSRMTAYWRFTTTYSEITLSGLSDLLDRDGRNKDWFFTDAWLETELKSNLFILKGGYHYLCHDSLPLFDPETTHRDGKNRSHRISQQDELSQLQRITDEPQTHHLDWASRESYPDLEQLRADFDAVYSLPTKDFPLLPNVKQVVVGVYGTSPTPVLFVTFGSGFVVPSKSAYAEAGKDDITAITIEYKLVHRTLFGDIELTRTVPGFQSKKMESGISSVLYDRLRIE
jgi:hypothetical protein